MKDHPGDSDTRVSDKEQPNPAVPAASLKRHAVKEWLRANSSHAQSNKLDVSERWDCADEAQVAAADALIKQSAPKKKRARDEWDIEYDKGKTKKVRKKKAAEEDLSNLFKDARQAARGRGGRDGGRRGGLSWRGERGGRGRGRAGRGRGGGPGRGGRGGGRSRGRGRGGNRGHGRK